MSRPSLQELDAERLSLALAATRLGDWSWDASTDVITMSPRAAEILTVSATHPFTRAGLRRLLHPDDRERNDLAFQQALSTRTDYAIEYRVLNQGRTGCVSALGRGRYRGTEVLGMLGVVQDITESVRSRETLQSQRHVLEEQAESLQAINQLGQMFAAGLDLEKIVQALTDAATEMTGAQFGAFFYNLVDEHGGSSMLYTLSGVDRAHFSTLPMPRASQLFGPTFRGEGTIRLDDVRADPRFAKDPPFNGMPPGHLPVRSYLAVPVISRSGGVIGGLFFGHSVQAAFSDRHERAVVGLAGQAAIAIDNARLFESAQRARTAAEDANRLKDEFLATVSHELRTPLNAVLGWARLLRGPYLDETQRLRAVDTIERNVKLQQAIIEDLLDVSRIISGKLRLDVSPILLAPVIEAAVHTLQPTALAKGIHVETTLEARDGVVLGDPGRLQQIVWNLLSNALKFTPRGGRVEIVLERAHSRLQVRVADTGCGITPAFLPHVFDRFRQADAGATRAVGGLGLGLAIVRHLAEMHAGSVSVQSDGEGRGATFIVELPLAALTESAPVVSAGKSFDVSVSAPIVLNAAALAAVRVLVVDDEADNRELVKTVLSGCGADVRTAASGAEAWTMLRQWTPDVILSDVGMPDEDGYSFIARVRAEGARIPAAALTAYARSVDRLRALSAGFQAHLPKPAEPSELVALVASLAEHSPRKDL